MRWIYALIGVTTVLAVVGMLSVWANRLLLNPHNWSQTSTQLLQNPDIRSATSNYIVDEVYSNVNVAALIRSGLPSRLDPLAAPLAGALRNGAVQAVDLALKRPRVQSLWAKANYAADQTLVSVVNGGKGAVGVKNGVVTLNLATVIDHVATRLGISSSVTSKLPPSIGTLTVLRSHQLNAVQKVGNVIKHLALWLTIIVFVLYALAVFLARGRRRRAFMTVGFAFVFAGLIGVLGRKLLVSQITNSVTSDASLRPAVRATIAIGTQILGDIAVAFVAVGAVFVVAAWFAGPAGIAVSGRRAIAPFLREHPGWTYAIVATVMLLIFIWQPFPATGTAVGIIVFSALALLGTEALRRQTEAEFPDAKPGDARAALRARFSRSRGRGQHAAPPAGADSIADQLERLAKLRDDGEITAAEYDAAKSSLLHA